MIDEPTTVRDGEELDAAKLKSYLDAHLESGCQNITVEQFPSGYSNLTYRVICDDNDYVLRRPPFGNQVKSAHDMGREFRVLSQLSKAYAPAPRPLLYCQDSDVLGEPFYLMERRRGVILRGPKPPEEMAEDTDLVRQTCLAFIDNLAQLHSLDYRAIGLDDLGKPDGYIGRQVNGWRKRYEHAKTHDMKAIEQLGDWLADNMPIEMSPSLLHNDYKYDNLILDPDDLSHIIGVLDWEMSTIGDPLMDLGMALAYWIEANDPPAQLAIAFGPTMVPGSVTRQQLVDRYQKTSGLTIDSPLFYYTFGLFKLAVIVQQIYARYAQGKTQDPRFAKLNLTVESLGQSGVEAIAAGRIGASS